MTIVVWQALRDGELRLDAVSFGVFWHNEACTVVCFGRISICMVLRVKAQRGEACSKAWSGNEG